MAALLVAGDPWAFQGDTRVVPVRRKGVREGFPATRQAVKQSGKHDQGWRGLRSAIFRNFLQFSFAKYYTPFSSHTSKRNTNRFGIRSQHHCTVAHLKKAMIVVCLFTLETLLEAWATAAEGAAPAPSAPVVVAVTVYSKHAHKAYLTAASASEPDAIHLDRAAYL